MKGGETEDGGWMRRTIERRGGGKRMGCVERAREEEGEEEGRTGGGVRERHCVRMMGKEMREDGAAGKEHGGGRG